MNALPFRFLFLLLTLVGCATPTPAPEVHHVVLGSNSYGYPAVNVRLISVVQGDDFEARQAQVRYPDCLSGSLGILEFSGTINNSSLQTLNSMMQQITPCIRKDGRRVVTPVYLNSAEGELLLGTKLGLWFQSQGVEVIVTEGQVCESACALAYLGAQRKRVQANGRVVLHLSGEQGKGFDCARSVDMMPLKNYLYATAGKQSGQALFNQALSHCRSGKGWNLS
jgi:hypothetical protein